MLKTNSKKAVDNIKKYIVEHFDFSNYDDGTQEEPKTFEDIAKFILNCFEDEYIKGNEKYYARFTRQSLFREWCAGLPSVLDTCYYYNRSAVDDLAAILEETDEEKARCAEAQAEKLLSNLIYLYLVKGARK